MEDPDKEQPVTVELTYYVKQNIVFQGWSRRCEDDPKGTHRSQDGTKKLDDFIKTPALQTENGLLPLDIPRKATTFTCKYRPGSPHNKVYVKVKYVIVPNDFPKDVYCPALWLFDESKFNVIISLNPLPEYRYHKIIVCNIISWYAFSSIVTIHRQKEPSYHKAKMICAIILGLTLILLKGGIIL